MTELIRNDPDPLISEECGCPCADCCGWIDHCGSPRCGPTAKYTDLFDRSGWENPPATEDEVAALTPKQRAYRLAGLEAQAAEIVKIALSKHLAGRKLTGKVVLFSGGNDSTILLHLMIRLGLVDYAAHANTTIGIEATRQFVRWTCLDFNVPLIEKYPPKDYRQLVIENGFPGPGHHYKMFQRLKERCLRLVRKDLVPDPRNQRVLFIAGRRRTESSRRSTFRQTGSKAGAAQVPLHEREGSTIWASPLANWTKHDLVFYRSQHPDVPFNSVSDALGMSGECLCGSFAKEGELERIRAWYPETAAEIDRLEQEVRDAGWAEPHCIWGHMSKGKSANVRSGPLCTSCDARADGD